MTEEEVPLNSNTSTVKNARLVGVLDLDIYITTAVLSATPKSFQMLMTDHLCECVKCKTTQCIDMAPKQLSIQVMVKSVTTQLVHVLWAFGKIVQDILRNPTLHPTKMTKGMLLKADPFSLTFSGGIIKKIDDLRYTYCYYAHLTFIYITSIIYSLSYLF